jgi:hypothetical protein
MYYPLAWYKGPDKEIDPFEQNRQKQVVGLIRTNFLKRFESSVVSFELSCERLFQKLLAFLEVHSETITEKKKLELWKLDNAEILGYARKRQLELLQHFLRHDVLIFLVALLRILSSNVFRCIRASRSMSCRSRVGRTFQRRVRPALSLHQLLPARWEWA